MAASSGNSPAQARRHRPGQGARRRARRMQAAEQLYRGPDRWRSDRRITVIGEIAANYARQRKDSANTRGPMPLPSATTPISPCCAKSPDNDGVLEHALCTEPVDAKLTSFLFKNANCPVEDLQLGVDPERRFTRCIRWTTGSTPGPSLLGWRLFRACEEREFHSARLHDGAAFSAQAKADPPAESLDHPQLPRPWAQARVNAPLDQMARQGESRGPSTRSSALAKIQIRHAAPSVPCRAASLPRRARFAPAILCFASIPTRRSSRRSRRFRSD